MRILITGAAGFIGRHTARLLEACGHHVVATDFHFLGFEHLDVRDRHACHSLVRRKSPDAILHLAANPSVPLSVAQPANDCLNNVVGAVNVIDAASVNSIPVVLASSGGVLYGDPPCNRELRLFREDDPLRPQSPYGIGKVTAERYGEWYARERGLSVVALRYGNLYGPGQPPQNGVVARWLEQIPNGDPIVLHGDGSTVRDYVHVDDVAEANRLALERIAGLAGFEAINIGTGAGTRLDRLAELVAGCCHTVQYAPPRAGDLRWNVLDCRKAQRLLGWRAAVALEEGIGRLTAGTCAAGPA